MLTKFWRFVDTYNEELFFTLVIILVALLGFGLGRLSSPPGGQGGLEVVSTPVEVTELVEAIQAEEALVEEGSGEPTNIVGNKNSHIFHLSTCSGAKRMAERNKVYFASMQAALDAGYRAAGNCPGL